MESKKFKVGDRVRVVSNTSGHGFESGTVVLIKSYDVTRHAFGIQVAEGYPSWWAYSGDLEAIEPVPEDTTAKLSNPKDAIGSTKLPLNLVPDTLDVFAALAFTEGATKYGSTNWRVAGVRASIYYAAMKRHQMKYWNGEWADPVTGVPHLASVIACAAIILDANVAGKLTDDRPPKIDIGSLIDGLEPVVKHLKDLHADKNPHHHTQAEQS